MNAPTLAVEEIKRAVVDLKFPGFQLGSHCGEWNLDSPNLYPIYKTCQDLGAALFIHPWDMEMGGILHKFPSLKVCFAHGGGAFPYTVGRVQHGYKVRPDLCATDCDVAPREFLGKFWTDSLVHDNTALELLVDVIGEDRIMLGTDYPFPLGEVKIV